MTKLDRSKAALHVVLAAALVAGAGATVASGLPDLSFGNDGVYISTLAGNHQANDALIDSQGRYVMVGSRVGIPTNGSYLLRVGVNGAPDTSFNGTGDVLLVAPMGIEALVLSTIKQQADGKLLVAGRAGPIFVSEESARPYVCRLLVNGTLDPSFGINGCALHFYTAAATAESVTDMAIQPDGRIVVVGASVTNGNRRAAVLRLNTDGSRDRCFNDINCASGGSVYDPIAGNFIRTVEAVAMQSDGKIILAGSGSGEQSTEMIAVRLLSSGGVDAAFGNAGSRTVGFDLGGNNFDIANAVAVLSNGAIVLAGDATDSPNTTRAAVAKLTANGQLDMTFGQTGIARSTTFYSDVSLSSFGSDLVVQSDGKLVVGGTSYSNFNSVNANFAAWRLLPNGFTDTTFGYDGRITITTDDGPETTRAISTIDANDDYVVLFGFRRETNQSNPKAAIVRLDSDKVFADGFEAP